MPRQTLEQQRTLLEQKLKALDDKEAELKAETYKLIGEEVSKLMSKDAAFKDTVLNALSVSVKGKKKRALIGLDNSTSATPKAAE